MKLRASSNGLQTEFTKAVHTAIASVLLDNFAKASRLEASNTVEVVSCNIIKSFQSSSHSQGKT
jgi:hypothetical protein